MGRRSTKIPTGNFYLREGRTNNGNEGIIYLRYFVCGKYIEHSTDIKIKTDEWDKLSRQVTSANKDWKRLNYKLQVIKYKVDEKLQSYNRPLTARVMADILAGNDVGDDAGKNIDFITYALDYNQMRYDQDKISYSTFDNNRLYILRFQRFLKEKENGEFIETTVYGKYYFGIFPNAIRVHC